MKATVYRPWPSPFTGVTAVLKEVRGRTKKTRPWGRVSKERIGIPDPAASPENRGFLPPLYPISKRALQHVELLPQFRDLILLGFDLRMEAGEFGQGSVHGLGLACSALRGGR